jgi:hypothetical protein
MKTNKYNVRLEKTNRTYDGIVFDSEIEKRYYVEVVLPMIERGEIINYELQKKYMLQPGYVKDGKRVLPIYYDADFYIVDKEGREIVIDVKGFAEPLAKIKRKMFWYLYPNIKNVWVTYSKIDGGWVTYEDREKGARARRKLKKEIERSFKDSGSKNGNEKGK